MKYLAILLIAVSASTVWSKGCYYDKQRDVCVGYCGWLGEGYECAKGTQNRDGSWNCICSSCDYECKTNECVGYCIDYVNDKKYVCGQEKFCQCPQCERRASFDLYTGRTPVSCKGRCRDPNAECRPVYDPISIYPSNVRDRDPDACVCHGCEHAKKRSVLSQAIAVADCPGQCIVNRNGYSYSLKCSNDDRICDCPEKDCTPSRCQWRFDPYGRRYCRGACPKSGQKCVESPDGDDCVCNGCEVNADAYGVCSGTCSSYAYGHYGYPIEVKCGDIYQDWCECPSCKLYHDDSGEPYCRGPCPDGYDRCELKKDPYGSPYCQCSNCQQYPYGCVGSCIDSRYPRRKIECGNPYFPNCKC